MELNQYLRLLPYRELKVVGEVHQLKTSRKPRKEELILVVEGALLDAEHLKRMLSTLSEREREALDALVVNDGELEKSSFCDQFGEIVPYKPWQKGVDAHSWQGENEPAQQLAYLGLLFVHPRKPKAGQIQVVAIPDNLLSLLPPVASPAQVAALASEAQETTASQMDDLLHDVTMLLSFVHRQKVKALYKKRWLSKKNLHHLNERLAQPEELGNIRSELQSTRVRFVHFLAESADLIGVIGEHFATTPAGWQWLKASPEQQIRDLWQAWQTPTDEQVARWRRYRYAQAPSIQFQSYPKGGGSYYLPDTPTKEIFQTLDCLVTHLATCVPQKKYDFSAFVSTLWAQEPQLWKFEISATEALKRGWVELYNAEDAFYSLRGGRDPSRYAAYPGFIGMSEEDRPLFEWPDFTKDPWNDAQRKSQTVPKHVTTFVRSLFDSWLSWWGFIEFDSTHFTLTSFAHWHLNDASTPFASTTSSEAAFFTLNDLMQVTIHGNISAETRVKIENIAQPLTPTQYQLTIESVAAAIGRGMSQEEILSFLHQEIQGGLSKKQRHTLRAWYQQIGQVRLHHVTLLETNSPALMTELTRPRRIREHIRRTLSPRAVIVNEKKVGLITRHLLREGIPLTDAPTPSLLEDHRQRQSDKAQPAHLLYALYICQALSQWVEPPQRIPASLIDTVSAELDKSTCIAAKQNAADYIEQIKHKIKKENEEPLPYSYRVQHNGLPQEDTLPLIEQAISETRYLTMTYWTASRGVRSERKVEPMRIEWSGDIAYVVAYCLRAMNERRFRVGRIEQITLGEQIEESERPLPPEWSWQWG